MSIRVTINLGWIVSTLGVVFLVLKLLDVINWSWWIVTLPFYGPVVLIVLVSVVLATIKALKGEL